MSIDWCCLPAARRMLPVALLFLLLPGSSFAQVGLGTPAGVTASDSEYRDRIAVTWDVVRGATSYRIFRASTPDPSSAVDRGTTASWVFFDQDPALQPGQTFHYWVRAENGTTVSGLGGSDAGTVAQAGPPGPVPPLQPPPEPQGNRVALNKASLGKLLFWDEQLSSTRTVACGSCHMGGAGGVDPRSILGAEGSTHPGADGLFGTADDGTGSAGVPLNDDLGLYGWDPVFGMRPQVTGRMSRTAIDAAFSRELFWDGRAGELFADPVSGVTVIPQGAALESQVLGPPVSTAEMGHLGRDWTDVASRVAGVRPLALAAHIPTGLSSWIAGRDYPALFQEVFGTPDVTPSRIALAIATYERTLYSDRTPFDRLNAGIAQLSPPARAGLQHFNQAGCVGCHGGPVLSNEQFLYIGVRPANEDEGRRAVTGRPEDLGAFRTAGLRNVALRGPYMHNGSIGTLPDVVDFYDRGGNFNAPNKDPRIRPLGLSPQMKSELVAFLTEGLTDPRVAAEQYPFDRPALYTETGCTPLVFGEGRPGSGGRVPQPVVLEPSVLGNPSFTVGVTNARGGQEAVLVIDDSVPRLGEGIPSGSFARVLVGLGGQGVGAGFGSVSLQIPDVPAQAGRRLFGRWFVRDPEARGRLAASPAFRIVLFPEYPEDQDGNGVVDVCEVR